MRQTVGEVMTSQVVTVAPDAPYKRAVMLLLAHGVNASPVVDGRGRPLGIVSTSDLVLKEEHPPGEAVPLLQGGRGRAERRKARGVGEGHERGRR